MRDGSRVALGGLVAAMVVSAGLGRARGQDFNPPQPAPGSYNAGVGPSDQSSVIDDLRRRIEANEAELRALKAQQQPAGVPASPAAFDANANANANADAAAAANPFCTPKEVPIIEKPTVALHGRLLTDVGIFNQSVLNQRSFGTANDGWDFREVRLQATGNTYENIDYSVEMDFAGNGRPSFQDNDFINFSALPVVGHIKVGRYKEYYSLEDLTSTNFITFMERGLPNVFSPGKSLGITAYDWTEDLSRTWAVGYHRASTNAFGDSVANDGDNAVTTRVTWCPYYDEPSDGAYVVHFGGSYSFRQVKNDQVSFASAPEVVMREDTAPGIPPTVSFPNFVNTGTLSATNVQLFNVEAAFVNGPLSLQSQYMAVPILETNGTRPFIYGFYAYASYFLTGEHRQYNRQKGAFDRINVYEPFFRVRTCDGICCGHGAWELATRVSYLNFNDLSVKGGQVLDETIGLNWYLNNYTRTMFEYIHSEPTSRTNVDSTANLFMMRAQIDF